MIWPGGALLSFRQARPDPGPTLPFHSRANAESTARTPAGTPYRRQIPVFEARNVDGSTGVTLAEVRPDQSEFRKEYDPSHPAADAEGYVLRPNVNSLVEAMDMREAQRAYEANLNVIETARAMDARILDLLKK